MSRFDEVVDRTGMASVKLEYTPSVIKEAGHNSLWGAEFDFPTAPFVVDAVCEWARKGLYAYTITTDDFRALVQSWMLMHRNWKIEKEWIVPVYGISASLATAMRAFTKEGDGIISMEPGYHNYWKAVKLGNRKKVGNKLIYTGSGYEVDWQDLEAKMSDPANKMIVLCNPHNPTGKVFSADDLKRIGELAKKYDIIIFNDEIFAECIFNEKPFVTVDQAAPGAKVLTATSLGKWLSFTGTNQANMIIPDKVLRERFTLERNKEFYGSMNPMMLPAYRAAYTKEGEEWLAEMMAYVWDNYKLVAEYYSRIPGFKAIEPEGTFIMWTDASEFCNNEEKLVDFLNNKAHFHVDAALQYDGDEGFFRMNLAMPRHELEKNLKSLELAVKELGSGRL